MGTTRSATKYVFLHKYVLRDTCIYTGVALLRRGRIDTLGHFFIVSNHNFAYDVAFRSSLGRFRNVKKKVCFSKNAFVCLSYMVQTVDILCINGHLRNHTRTPKNTTLHHPSMHYDIDTDQNTTKSLHFRTHLDEPRNFVGQQRNGSWQLVVVAGLGDSGGRCLVRQVGRCHRQRPWVAKQQCSSTCCCNQVRRPVATLCRPRRLTPELLDEIREFTEEEHGRISVKNRAKSLHILSYLQSKGHQLSALASVGDPHSAPSGGPSHP